jgi:hypothetical protein
MPCQGQQQVDLREDHHLSDHRLQEALHAGLPPCIPIDGGIGLLLAAGAFIGVRRIYKGSEDKAGYAGMIQLLKHPVVRFLVIGASLYFLWLLLYYFFIKVYTDWDYYLDYSIVYLSQQVTRSIWFCNDDRN